SVGEQARAENPGDDEVAYEPEDARQQRQAADRRQRFEQAHPSARSRAPRRKLRIFPNIRIIAPFFPSRFRILPHMANIASARKRARQSEKRRQHNAALRSELRSAIRNVRKAIAAGDKKAAQDVYRRATSAIDSIADKHIIHKNTAARHKSRLAARIRAMA